MKTEEMIQFPVPVSKTVLDNGLTVLTADTGSVFVTCWLAFNAGGHSVQIPGTAHFLEHVLGKSIHNQLKDGALPHVATKMETSNTRTAYQITGEAGHAIGYVELLLTHVFNPAFDEEIIEFERSAILAEYIPNEFRCKLEEELGTLIYPRAKSLHQVTPGDRESIKRITGQDLQAFWDEHYHLKNCVLIVAGGVQHNQIVEAVESHQLPACNIAKKTWPVVRPKIIQREFTTSFLPERPNVEFYFAHQRNHRQSFYQALCLLGYLCDSDHGPLFQQLRYQHRLIYSLQWSNYVRPALFSLYTDLRREDIGLFVSTIYDALGSIAKEGPNPQIWYHTMQRAKINFEQVREKYLGPNSYSDWAGMLFDCWQQNDYVFTHKHRCLDYSPEQITDFVRAIVKVPSGLLIMHSASGL